MRVRAVAGTGAVADTGADDDAEASTPELGRHIATVGHIVDSPHTAVVAAVDDDSPAVAVAVFDAVVVVGTDAAQNLAESHAP